MLTIFTFLDMHPTLSEEMNVDYEQLERIASLDVQPHVLILPSDLLHFIKEVNGCIAMNPQRLARGDGGGVFCRMIIRGATSQSEDKSLDVNKQVFAEIVRI